MWPSNFEGDGLHLYLLKTLKFLGVAHFSSTQMLWQSCQLSKICGITEMVMKQEIPYFSLVAPLMKAMFICEYNLENMIRLTSNFHNKNICFSSLHSYRYISRKHSIFCCMTNIFNVGARDARNWNVKACQAFVKPSHSNFACEMSVQGSMTCG